MITTQQLEEALVALRGTSGEAKIRSLVAVLDEDHDGNINLEEVAEVCVHVCVVCMCVWCACVCGVHVCVVCMCVHVCVHVCTCVCVLVFLYKDIYQIRGVVEATPSNCNI